MAKFQFRLQKFLQLKEKLEDQKRIEFGNAARALAAEEQKKAAMEREKAESLNALRKETEQRVDPVTWQMWNGYIEATKRRIAAQERVVAAASDFLEAKRGDLVESMRERKTIEVLRDKAHSEWSIEEKKAEQKLLDETVSTRFARG